MKTPDKRLWYVVGYEHHGNKKYYVRLEKNNYAQAKHIPLNWVILELLKKEYERGKDDLRREIRNKIGIN